jgi:hypothetical protein
MTIDSGGRTIDDYTDCVVYYPDGMSRRGQTLKDKLRTVDQAIDALGSGQMVCVRLGDAQRIEDWLAGGPR